MAFNLSAQLSVALNTASLKNAAATINNQLKDVGTLKIGLPSGVASSLKDITAQAQEASNAMEQFGRQSGLAAKRFIAFTITAGAIIQFTSSVKQALSSAIEFDREMIRLAQVSTDSAGDVGKIGSEVGRLSKAYGVSSKELINTAVTLKQANLTLKETKDALEALAQAALAPSFDNLKDTTEGAIAIMNQFNISSRDLGTALGSVNSVAAEFAVEAQDLIEGVRKAGGAFRSAGGDLNQFLALFTSIRQTTRESAESIGTGLRTIFTRIQRNDTVEALKEIGVQLRYTADEAKAAGDLGLTNQFVGPYEAVKRLSAALNELRSTDPRFSAIVEELGGYRQISKVIPLVQEFAVSQKALGVAQAGSASLAANAAQAQEAFGVKIQKVAEQFNSFVRDLTNTASFRAIVDLMLQGASAAIQLADSLKGILPIITAIAAVKFTQGITSFAKGFANTAFSPVQGNQPSTLSMSPFLPIKSKKADGGFIKMAKGGFVPGSGRGDKIPALLEPGEYVIPRKFAAGALVKAFQVAKNANVVQQKIFDPKSAVTEKDYQSGKFINPNDNFAFSARIFSLSDPESAKVKTPYVKGEMFETFAAGKLKAKRTKASFDVDLIGADGFPYEVKNEAKLSGDDIFAAKLARFRSRLNKNAFANRIDEDTIDLGAIGIVVNTANLEGGKGELNKIVEERNYKIGNVEKESRKNFKGSIPQNVERFLKPKASGGLVPGIGNTDSVPLDLPIGSYVIKKSSVSSIGASNLSRLGRAKGGVIPSLVMPGEYIYAPDEVKNIGVSNLDYMNATGRRRFAAGGYSDDEKKAYRTKKTEEGFRKQIELQLRIPTSDDGREQNRIEAQSIAEDITKTSKRIKELENNVKKYSNEIGSGLRNEQNLNSVKTRILSDIQQRERIVQQTKQKEAEELRILQSYNDKIRKKESEARGYKTLAAGARAANDEETALKYEKKQRTLEGQAARYKTLQSNKQAVYDAAVDTRILAEQNLAKSNNELDKTNKKLKSNRDKLDLLEKAKGGAEKERADLVTKYSSDREGRILKDGKVITSQYMSGNKTEYQKMLNREMASYRKTFGEKPVGDVRKAIETGFAEKLQRSYFNQLQTYAKAKGIGFDESLASAQATQMVREAEAGRRKVEKTKTGEFFDPTLGTKLRKEGYSETGSKRGYIRLAKDFFSKENYQNIVFSGAALAGVTSEAITASNEKNIRAAASGNEAANSRAQSYGAFSGSLTGAATGASIGSFLGPTGAIVGGIIGGLSGLVSGIKDVKKQISDIKLSEATEKLKAEFEIAATSFGKISAVSFGNIKRLQNQIDREIETNAAANVGIFSTIKSSLGFTSSYDKEKNAGIIQQTKSQYAGQAAQINALISKQLEEEVKSNKNFNIGEFFNDSDINNQMSRLAIGLQQPLDTIKKQFIKFAADVSKQQELTNRIQQGVKAQEQLIISFSALSSAAIDAANSLNDVSPKFKTVSDLLSGNTSISQVRRRSVDAESISSNPQAFLSSLREVSGGLGNFGRGFETSGQIIASISSSLPAILSQVNPLETSPGRDPANVIKGALRENLKQQGFKEEDISRYINTIIGKMGDDFSKLLNESGGDYGELAKKLTSSISEPLLRSFKDISMSLETAADKYVEGLNRLTQANLNTIQEYDRLSKIQAQNRAFLKSNAIENEITKTKAANPMGFRFNEIRTEQIALDMTNVDEQIQAFREQQTRLTGLQNGQELSPAAIQARIRSNREKTEIAQQKYDESRLTAGPNNRGIYEAAARELQALKQETSMLNSAMRNLADSTDELSAIENRIGAIRRELADEEQRNIRKQQQTEQTGERLLTSSPEQIQRYQAGAQLTGIAEASGGNLLKFNVEQRKAIFEYLDLLGDEGQKRKSQLLQASGFVAKPETTAQEKYATELQVLIKRMIEVGMRREAAQSLIIDEQKTVQQSFFAELTRQNEKFFSRLEANLIKKEAEQKSEQQRNIEGRIGALQAIEPSVRMFGGMDTATYNAQIKPRQRDITNYLSTNEKLQGLNAEWRKYTGIGAFNIINNSQVNGQMSPQSLMASLQSVNGVDRSKLNELALNFTSETANKGLNNEDLSLLLGNQLQNLIYEEIVKTKVDLNTAGSKVGIKEGKADTDLGRFVQSLQSANVTSQAFSKAVDDIARLGNIVGVQYFNELEKLKNQSIQAAQGVAVLNQQLGQRNIPLQNQPVVAPRQFAFGGMVTASSGIRNADPRVFRPKGPDTIPAILSPGEFVINAKATSENLPLLQTLNNGGQVNYLEDGGMPQLAAPVPMNFLEAQRVREYQKDMAVKQAIITRFGILRGSWRTNALSNSYRIQRGDANFRNVPFLNGSADIQAVVSPFVKNPWTKINDISQIGLKTPFNAEQIAEIHNNKQNIFGMPLSMKLLDIGDLLSATEDYLYSGQEAGPNNPFREINKNKQFYQNASKIKEFFEAWLMIGSPIVNADGVKEFYNVKKKMDVIGFSSGGQSNGFTPAMLNRGEFVVNAKSANKNLPLLQKLNKGGKVNYLQSGGDPLKRVPKITSASDNNTKEARNKIYEMAAPIGLGVAAASAIYGGYFFNKKYKQEKYANYTFADFDKLLLEGKNFDPNYFENGTKNQQRLKEYLVSKMDQIGLKVSQEDIIFDKNFQRGPAYIKDTKKIHIPLEKQKLNTLQSDIIHEGVHLADYAGEEKGHKSKKTQFPEFRKIVAAHKQKIESTNKIPVNDSNIYATRILNNKDNDAYFKKMGLKKENFTDLNDLNQITIDLKKKVKLSDEQKLKIRNDYLSRPIEVLARVGELLSDSGLKKKSVVSVGNVIDERIKSLQQFDGLDPNITRKQYAAYLLSNVLNRNISPLNDATNRVIDARDQANANAEIEAALQRRSFRRGKLTGPPKPSLAEQEARKQADAVIEEQKRIKERNKPVVAEPKQSPEPAKPIVEESKLIPVVEEPKPIVTEEKVGGKVYEDVISEAKKKNVSPDGIKNILKKTNDFKTSYGKFPNPIEINDLIDQEIINQFNSPEKSNSIDIERANAVDLEVQKNTFGIIDKQVKDASVRTKNTADSVKNTKSNPDLDLIAELENRAIQRQLKIQRRYNALVIARQRALQTTIAKYNVASSLLAQPLVDIIADNLKDSKNNSAGESVIALTSAIAQGTGVLGLMSLINKASPIIGTSLGAVLEPIALPSWMDSVSNLVSSIEGIGSDSEVEKTKQIWGNVIPNIDSLFPKKQKTYLEGLLSGNIIPQGNEQANVGAEAATLGVGSALTLGAIALGTVGTAGTAGLVGGLVIGTIKTIADSMAVAERLEKLKVSKSARTVLDQRYSKRGFDTADFDYIQNPNLQSFLDLQNNDPATFIQKYSDEIEASLIPLEDSNWDKYYDILNKYPYFSVGDAINYRYLEKNQEKLTGRKSLYKSAVDQGFLGQYVDEISNLEKAQASTEQIKKARQKYLDMIKPEEDQKINPEEEKIYERKKIVDKNLQASIFAKSLYLKNDKLNRETIKKKINILSLSQDPSIDLIQKYLKSFENNNDYATKQKYEELYDGNFYPLKISDGNPPFIKPLPVNFKDNWIKTEKKYSDLFAKSNVETYNATEDILLNQIDSIDKNLVSQKEEYYKKLQEKLSFFKNWNTPAGKLYNPENWSQSEKIKTEYPDNSLEDLLSNLYPKYKFAEAYNQGDDSINYKKGMESQYLINLTKSKSGFTEKDLTDLYPDELERAAFILFLNDKIKFGDFASWNVRPWSEERAPFITSSNLPEPVSTLDEFFQYEFSNYLKIATNTPSIDKLVDARKIVSYKASGGIVPKSASNPNPSLFVPKGTDTVPAMLSPGEYVVNAKATAENLPLLQNLNRGGVVYKASGGLLSSLGSLNPEDEKRLAEITKQPKREDLITNLGKETNQEIKIREERLRLGSNLLGYGLYLRNPKATYDNFPLSNPNTLNNRILNLFDSSSRKAYSRGSLVDYLNKTQQNPFFNDVKYVKSGGIIYAAGGYSVNPINSNYARMARLSPGLTAINTAPEFLGMERGNGGFSSQRVFGKRPTYYYDAGIEGAAYRKNERFYENARLNTLENLANYMADRFGTLNRDKSKWYTWNVAWGKALETFGIGGQGGQFSLSQTNRPIADLGAMMNMSSFFAGPKFAYAQKYAIENWTWEDILNNDEVVMGPNIGGFKKSDVGTRYIEGLIGGPPIQNGRGKTSLNKYRNILAFSKAGNTAYQGISANAALAKGTLADLPGANLSASAAAISDVQNYGLGKLSVNNTDMAAAKYYTGLQSAITSAYNQPIYRTTPSFNSYGNNWSWGSALENQRRNASLYNQYQARGFKNGGHSGTDTIPAMLTPGEFVVKKEAVNKVGTGFLNKINNAKGYSNGGLVNYYADGSNNGVSSARIGTATAVLDLSSLSSATSSLSNASSFFSDASQSISSAITSTGSLLGGLVSNLGTSNGLIEKASSAINSASNGFLSSSITFAQNITTLATAITSIPRTITLNVAPVTMNVAFNTAAVLQAIQASISQIESTALSQINSIVSRQIDERLG